MEGHKQTPRAKGQGTHCPSPARRRIRRLCSPSLIRRLSRWSLWLSIDRVVLPIGSGGTTRGLLIIAYAVTVTWTWFALPPPTRMMNQVSGITADHICHRRHRVSFCSAPPPSCVCVCVCVCVRMLPCPQEVRDQLKHVKGKNEAMGPPHVVD